MQQLRRQASGQSCLAESAQLQDEVKQMCKEDREKLLKSITDSTVVSSEEVLAFKADLGIPYNKLRTMRRLIIINYMYVHDCIIIYTSTEDGGRSGGCR